MLRLLHAVCILHIFIVKQVTGTVVTLSPAKVVTLNSEISFNQTLRCTLSDDEKNAKIVSLLYMQIYYHRLSSQTNNQAEHVIWASIHVSPDTPNPPVLGVDIPSSLRAVVSGQLTTQAATELTLTWNSTNVGCIDTGSFYCIVSHLQSNNLPATWNTTALETLTVQRITINLEMRKGGVNIGVNSATKTNPLSVVEGDVFEFKCIAEIGDSSDTLIKWSSIRPFPEDDVSLQLYTPSGISTSSDDNGCGKTKTATFSYNVTQNDIERNKILGFACNFTYDDYLSKQVPVKKVPVNSQAFYLQPEGSDSGGKESSGASVQSAGTNTGAIAGGVVGGIVLVVLIVLLVYFLWYRRRGDGETCSANVAAILGGIIGGLLLITAIVVIVWLFWFRQNSGESYRTKEERGSENPNMVSNAAATDYAVPHKERRGYENDAMDEPHQDRSRRRDDRGRNDHSHKGRSNHAMDRDYDDYYNDGGDDSPTMTPHLNHMGGGDPHSSIGTGV